MTQFKVLMTIPERRTAEKRALENIPYQQLRIIQFLKDKESIDGVLQYISCNENFSQYIYGIDNSEDALSIEIINDCKEINDILSKHWRDYACIVFDLEDQCFTKAFFEQKKDMISEKIPIVKLVDMSSENLLSDKVIIQPDKEKNIIEIDKSDRVDLILETILRLVKKPKITFFAPDSMKIDKIEIRNRYGKIFRNAEIELINSRDGKNIDDNNFSRPNKINFFVYLIDSESFNHQIDLIYQIVDKYINQNFRSVILIRKTGEENFVDYGVFFSDRIKKLESHVDVIKSNVAMKEEARAAVIRRHGLLIDKKDEIQICFEGFDGKFNFSNDFYFDANFIFEIIDKMRNNCRYSGIIGSLDEEESKKLISVFMPKKIEEPKMGNTIINVGSVHGNFAGNDYHDHSHTENYNDYRQQLANFVKEAEKDGLSEAQQETLNKLKHLLNDKTRDSESLLSKISSRIKTVVGISKDLVPSIELLIKHKSEIMGVIGAVMP